MTSTTAALLEYFLIGLATPLTATCVLPLYPGFLAYLASTGERNRGPPVPLLGLLVVAGVIAFMASVGGVWTLVFQRRLQEAVEIFSPIAFAILTVVGVVLIVAPNGFSRLPTIEPPHSRYPALSAFGYGFFFGAIVIPCNPGTIALFISRSTAVSPGFDTQLEVLTGFLAFGLGIGAPLLALALLSQPYGQYVARTLARNSSVINRVVGVVLIVVSLDYLIEGVQVVPLPG